MVDSKFIEDSDHKVRAVNPATCLLEIITHVNGEEKRTVPPTAAETKPLPYVSKRLGRGVVSSGLTCECGVFGAMACGEWPTQRVSVNK